MKQSIEKEALRQLYLQAMDIQVWYPRFSLPHTDTVREYDWLTPARASTAVSESTAQIDSAARRNNSPEIACKQPAPGLVTEGNHDEQVGTEALQQDHGLQKVPRQKTEIADLPDEEFARKAASDRTVQFAFAWLAVSDNLTVICEIPYQTRGRLQAPIRSLLARILEALSVPVRPGTTPVIHFHWPLYEAELPTHSNQLENELLYQGINSARQTVHAFLARQLNDRPAPFLLIFSEQWPDYLFPADFTAVDARGLFKHPQFDTQVLITRGLHAMQADDSVKKPVWQNLQLLRTQIMRLRNAEAKLRDLSADSRNSSVKPRKDEY